MAGANRNQRRSNPSSGVTRQIIEADQVPDLYADEFWFTAHPMGATLTLVSGIPPGPGDVASAPKARVVGRVRMSPQLAVELGRIINDQVAGKVTMVSTETPDGPPN